MVVYLREKQDNADYRGKVGAVKETICYRVFGNYCPFGRLNNLSGVKVFYKSAAFRCKGLVFAIILAQAVHT